MKWWVPAVTYRYAPPWRTDSVEYTRYGNFKYGHKSSAHKAAERLAGGLRKERFTTVVRVDVVEW